MKKFFSLLVAVLFLFLCSCDNNEPQIIKTADMLSITNEEKNLLGCMSRFEAVISAVSAKITTLENAHNTVIEYDNEKEYFLDENYILTSFEPFVLNSLSITDGFTPDMTNKNAQEFYAAQSEGFDVTFNSYGESYELLFVSESLVKTHTADYDAKKDSIRFVYSLESSGHETVEEFLEFTQTDENIYVIQSQTERCYVEFGENGEIIYFCIGKLSNDIFSPDESIFDKSDKEIDNFWVLEKGKPSYSNIHTFENNILIHEDCSGGPWKTIKINADDYASAFYGQ